MAETRAAQAANTKGRAMVQPARYINTIGTAQTDTEPAEITYRPQPGDPDEIEAYGRKFKAGEAVEVPGQFVDKARGNPAFEVAGEKTFGDEKQEQQELEEQEDASFEDNLARERAQEYLEGRTHFAMPPGEAERVARAQEAAAELQAAQEDEEDKDEAKPRRGRPRKSEE